MTIANPWCETAEANETILHCKPHGSLSWQGYFPENGRSIRILNDPITEEENDYDFALGTDTHAAVIAPVPFKSEIIDFYRNTPQLCCGWVQPTRRATTDEMPGDTPQLCCGELHTALQLSNVPTFFHLLVAQWSWAIQRISEAEKLIVLGYGFPPEDLHAHYLFAEATAIRKSHKKLEIEVYESCEQRFEDVKKEIDKIFKPTSCKYQGTVIP